jgi:uncharacterized integral membrane protein
VALGYLLAALASAAIAVFALQNSEHTRVRFLVWSVDGLPVAAVALGALAVGLVIVGLPCALRIRRWRSQALALEARVRSLETALAERDRALLRGQRPPEPPPARP